MPTALNNTLTKLASVTLGAGQTTISFTSIPQTYTDLVVKFSINSASNNQYIRFNGSSAAEYQIQTLRGNGSAADNYFTGTNQTEFYFMASGIATDTFGSGEIYITNYTAATQKSLFINAVGEANTATVYSNQIAGSWTNNSAITQIDIVCAAGLAQYSSATLYGVNPVKTQALATGGDIIVNDGTYWYHAFLASGIFTPSKALTNVNYLVIAGGGGGTGSFVNAGYAGTGAGGLRSTVTTTGGGGTLESAISLNSGTAYTVTVGAGGAAGGSGGSSGSNSSLSGTGLTTITSLGGGARNTTGGSGGGGSYDPNTYGLGTAGQGYRGGNGYIVGGGDTNGGGGGGAGAVGGNASSTNAGNGGVGVQITALAAPTGTGVTGYYAGGGGAAAEASGRTAGVGGYGGGGNGAVAGGNATSATVNTGGGGGAAGGGTGGSGGSGLVIIRYAMA